MLAPMPTVIHARSLAKVVELADNPPAQYQDREHQALREWSPLVLYIARVPGNRDVFLTTMKPQEKVVTASDVQSCLYYVHVDSPADMELMQSEGLDVATSTEGAMENELVNRLRDDQNHIRRKPVLPARTSVTTIEHPTDSSISSRPTRVSGEYMTSVQSGAIQNKQNRQPGGLPGMDVNTGRTAQAILGPRPMHTRSAQTFGAPDVRALQSVPSRQNIDTKRWSNPPIPPCLPPRPHEQKSGGGDETYSAGFVGRRQQLPQINSHTRVGAAQELSLTLIRRYDNTQSNIARIWAAESPSDTICLDLTAPGYAAFVHRSSGAAERANSQPKEDTIFRSHLHTVATQRPSLYARAESQDSPLGIRPGLRESLDLRRRSFFGSNSLDVGHSGMPASYAASPKGHHFQSPWNGRCEFTTGVAGRSLKCKHTPPSRPHLEPATVSELRFNLPSSKSLGSSHSTGLSSDQDRRSKRASFFSTHQRQRSSVSAGPPFQKSPLNAEPDDRMDLSLGQERAGGGFGGKQAKLGKLIVEQEGLQMLDLIVAANMALWWRVYDRMA